MYSNAENKMQVASIHIFGIKYGKNIIQNAFKSLDIVKAAGINESYSTELQKALNIYRCLEQNSYGIYISDENAIKEEKEVLGERKTGAENILLYGVPGSGKSHEIKTKYCNDEKMMERVVFHPDYTYSDFVGQILPRVEKDKDGNEKLKYVFTPGPFTRMLKKAQEDPSNHYYLVIEELNRGNAPAIFGEIFQLLDRKDEDEFPGSGVWMFVLSMLVYGVAFDFFNVSGSLFVDKTTDSSIRSSAQGLFMLMTNGIGATVGTLSAQAVVNSYTDANGVTQWAPCWLIFAGYALVVAVSFAVIFRPKKA